VAVGTSNGVYNLVAFIFPFSFVKFGYTNFVHQAWNIGAFAGPASIGLHISFAFNGAAGTQYFAKKDWYSRGKFWPQISLRGSNCECLTSGVYTKTASARRSTMVEANKPSKKTTITVAKNKIHPMAGFSFINLLKFRTYVVLCYFFNVGGKKIVYLDFSNLKSKEEIKSQMEYHRL
jgi:hypothetical protein